MAQPASVRGHPPRKRCGHWGFRSRLGGRVSASRLMTLPTTRSDLVRRIAPLLAQLGGPSTDAAVHSLTELREALPLLLEEYHRESDAERRRLLIHCIWQYRDPGVIPTLAAALDDANDRVWRESLDGLVTLGTGEALVILGH